MSGKMESQNSYSSFKSESEVSHSVTTTTAYPETTYTRYSHQRTKIKSRENFVYENESRIERERADLTTCDAHAGRF